MTGLEKIVAEIRGEAAGEAKALLDAAKAEAEEILGAARAEAKEKAASIAAAAAREAAEIERSRESAISLLRRRRVLEQKQALLAETLDKAREYIALMPDDEYFALLLRLLANAAQPGSGLLLLSEKDLSRIPTGFEEKLTQSLPSGCTLQLSHCAADIDGGFVLKYGDVEENGAFSAMFAARADEFSDLVRDVLFAG